MHFNSLAIAVCTALALTACATPRTQNATDGTQTQQTVVEDALQLKDDGRVAEAALAMVRVSQQSVGVQRAQYLFEAGQYYLQVPDVARAAEVLQKIEAAASGSGYATVLQAQISLRSGSASSALAILATAPVLELAPRLRGVYWLTLAEALQTASDRKLASAANKKWNLKPSGYVPSSQSRVASVLQARVKAEELLTSMDDLTKNQDAIWSLLSIQSPATLQSVGAKTKEKAVQAWVELATLAKKSNGAISQTSLATWRKKFPSLVVLNNRLLDLRGLNSKKLRHVAIILPTKSPELGASARAVWEGFQAAQKNNIVPYPIKLYETDSNPAAAVNAYRTAIEKGAVLIVGPLPRTSLSLLAQRRLLAVPTVALNAIEDEKIPVNLYQFGLPITQEARIIAHAAQQKGFTDTIVLRGKSALDARSADAFTKEWAQLQHGVVAELAVNDTAGLERLAASGAASKTMIFVASDFQHALPAIKGLSPQWSIFGTSALNTSSPEVARLDKGQKIYFVDAPSLVKTMIADDKKSIKDDGIHSRLYSLGLDVCALSAMLLQNEVRYNRPLMNGATGQLSVTRNGNVERDLPLVLLQDASLASYQNKDFATFSEVAHE